MENPVQSAERLAGPDPGRQQALHLLVTIPALDEEATVGDVVRGVPREMPGIGVVDVVVVDDGSRDLTAECAAEAGAHVIRHSTSRGVGAAFHSGLAFGID